MVSCSPPSPCEAATIRTAVALYQNHYTVTAVRTSLTLDRHHRALLQRGGVHVQPSICGSNQIVEIGIGLVKVIAQFQTDSLSGSSRRSFEFVSSRVYRDTPAIRLSAASMPNERLEIRTHKPPSRTSEYVELDLEQLEDRDC